MLIQLHILQSYAPANLNRDDTGAPKDAMFGGALRGRISSQCLKRSIRRSSTFETAFERDGLLGKRTKDLPRLIAEQLTALGADEEARKAIVARVPEIGRESGKRSAETDDEPADDETAATEPAAAAETKTKQLIFIGANELRPLAEKLLAAYNRLGAKGWKAAKIQDITRHLGKSVPLSVDIAMFGRMTTSDAFQNVQATVQVAHAISTNALAQEFDYYTAVDDLTGESGAGMIGDVEFNCSTYYKYVNVHWEELVKNLGGDAEVARLAVLALLEAAVTAQPSGKQNSFAAFNLPDLVLVEVSDRNLPVSYTNAFLKPVRAWGDRSLMDASIQALDDYLGRVSATYGLAPQRACICTQESTLAGAQTQTSLTALQSWLDGRLPR